MSKLSEAIGLRKELRHWRALETMIERTYGDSQCYASNNIHFSDEYDPSGNYRVWTSLREIKEEIIPELKARLAKLPHIPTKAERKKIRQIKAKQKKHR